MNILYIDIYEYKYIIIRTDREWKMGNSVGIPYTAQYFLGEFYHFLWNIEFTGLRSAIQFNPLGFPGTFSVDDSSFSVPFVCIEYECTFMCKMANITSLAMRKESQF